jgi:2-amino-4-hydroxy-6-hydroxymethyldihydropteridine diphosphokinase
MSIILSLGSNIDDRLSYLKQAIDAIEKFYPLLAKSSVYQSEPADYLDQSYFYNLCLEIAPDQSSPEEFFTFLQSIEEKIGRKKIILKGPRTIDIDIIFWNYETIKTKNLTIPHPSWDQRSFVVAPLSELPYFEVLKKKFTIPKVEDLSPKFHRLNISI